MPLTGDVVVVMPPELVDGDTVVAVLLGFELPHDVNTKAAAPTAAINFHRLAISGTESLPDLETTCLEVFIDNAPDYNAPACYLSTIVYDPGVTIVYDPGVVSIRPEDGAESATAARAERLSGLPLARTGISSMALR